MTKAMAGVVLSTVVGLAGAAYAQHDHGKMEKGGDHSKMGMEHKGGAAAGETVTLKGEVLDMACYMAHEGMGEKHAKCAKTCLLGGAPAGILGADGSVTLLVEDHNMKKPYKALLELAGQKAEVTGKRYTRGGLTAVVVSAVKKG
ncbi:MAG: hypothetical protein HY928_02570 [Elusimicrobia bacterium]|nr:hypothetical protein [Elusimicrobiota bacterium]